MLRSSRPPDSVAARFTQAFIQAGFPIVTFKRSADTAWATANLARLDTPNAALVSTRAVAYWHGDSTHFRYYVAVRGPEGGQASDTTDASRRVLEMCGQIARNAAIGWSAPRNPTGDETLPIWSRIP